MSQAGITYPIHIPQLKCNIESKPRQGAEIQNKVPKENIVANCISLVVIDHWSSKKQCTMGTWKVDAETRGVYFLSMKYPKEYCTHYISMRFAVWCPLELSGKSAVVRRSLVLNHITSCLQKRCRKSTNLTIYKQSSPLFPFVDILIDQQ